MLPPFVRVEAERTLIDVHVQPGTRTNEVAGVHGGRLKVKIAAPAADSAANRELCQFMAELFGVPRTCVQLLRGERSRQKTVVVLGAASLPASIVGLL